MNATLKNTWNSLGFRRKVIEPIDPVFENLITTWSELEPSLCVNFPDRREFSIERRLVPGIALGTYSYDDFEGIKDCLFSLVRSKNLGRVSLDVRSDSDRTMRAVCKGLLKSYVSQIADRRSIEVDSTWITNKGREVVVAVTQNCFPYIILLADNTWISRDLFLSIDDRGRLLHVRVDRH